MLMAQNCHSQLRIVLITELTHKIKENTKQNINKTHTQQENFDRERVVNNHMFCTTVWLESVIDYKSSSVAHLTKEVALT